MSQNSSFDAWVDSLPQRPVGRYTVGEIYPSEDVTFRYGYGNPNDLGYERMYELQKKNGVLNLALGKYFANGNDSTKYGVNADLGNGWGVGASLVQAGDDYNNYGVNVSKDLGKWFASVQGNRDNYGNWQAYLDLSRPI